MKPGHLYHDIAANLPKEVTDTIVHSPSVKIERIVSHGHCSPPGFWYEQAQNEWVIVLKGEASLRFEKDDSILHLSEGMHVHIAAGERHRLEWTSSEVPTVWLAVFYPESFAARQET